MGVHAVAEWHLCHPRGILLAEVVGYSVVVERRVVEGLQQTVHVTTGVS